jgi:hypothetical protein
MRFCPFVVLSIVGLLSACVPKVQPLAQPVVTPQMRMASADTQMRAGCLDCLEDAYREYTVLRADPIVGEAATQRTFRVAILIAVRTNELGLVDSGLSGRPRDVISTPVAPLSTFLDIGDALWSKPAGFSRGGVSDTETLALAKISRNHIDWATTLRTLMPGDLVADYLWLGLACGEYGFDIPDRQDRLAALADAFEVPLIGFKNAAACSNDRIALQGILDRNPRFVEANYFLGQRVLTGAASMERRRARRRRRRRLLRRRAAGARDRTGLRS